MDINRSPLSGYQSQKTETNRLTSEATSSSDSARIKKSSPSTGESSIKPSALKEGQILKGQVIDHRYQEVKLQLEPGKQIITAKLASNIPLSIGEEAAFQVNEDPSKQLVLKYIPNHTTAPMDATVMKALQASNLPLTEKNKAIAAELLNHRMPLDKQTLQNLVRLSYMNKEATPLTFVLMHKYNVPMTSSNIAQFEAYQKGTHQLLTDMKSITENLTDLLGKNDGTEASQTLSNNTSISSSQYIGTASPEQAIQRNLKLIEILLQKTNTTSEGTTNHLSNLLDQQELTLLKDLVELKLSDDTDLLTNSSNNKMTGLSPELSSVLSTDATNNKVILSKDLLPLISKGSISIEDTIKILDYLNFKDSIIPSKSMPDHNTNQALDHIFNKLSEHYENNRDTSPALTNFLGSTDSDTLLPHLSALPKSELIMERIYQGTATLKEVLDFIQTQLPYADKETAGKLLSSPVYARLLEEAFLEKWTLTPEKAAKKDAIENLYQQLQEDLKEISQLATSIKDSEALLQVKEPVKNLQDNLQFMKYLNEAFTYLQLPIQFKDQKTHTDLYVLSRKRSDKNHEEPASVLLHLEMKHLGALNIHIQLTKEQVQATFYPEDSQISRLLLENLPTLTDALENKGYQIHADIKDDYKKPDFCKDFIEQNAQDYNVQQFNFDIRT